MANPRTPLDELRLQNSPNLRRALERERAEGQEAAPLTEEQKTEVSKLDALISQAMHACRKGQTVKGKRNPAFANLALLVKTRKELISGGGKRKDKGKDKSPMEQLDEMLSKPN